MYMFLVAGIADMSDVAKLERYRGPEAATELFLQMLLKSEEQGWFQTFITALDAAGTCTFYTSRKVVLRFYVEQIS